MVKDRITITIDRQLLKKIDEKRGLINRSLYIEDILDRALRLKFDKAVVSR